VAFQNILLTGLELASTVILAIVYCTWSLHLQTWEM